MPDVAHTHPIAFDGFILDRQAGNLSRIDTDGVRQPVPLGSRALAVLAALATRNGQLVSKADIMDTVWPGLAVEENNLTVQISALRRILDQGRNGSSLIQTIPARGYRLVGQTSDWDAGASQPASIAATAPASCAQAMSPSNQPSLAVLPFVALGDEQPGLEGIADGIAEGVTVALARVRWFHVLGRGATHAYARQPVDARRIGGELGVQYLLEGSVQRAAGQLRITCQLIETNTGRNIWAKRLEYPDGNAFALQDSLTCIVTGALEPVIERAEIGRSRNRPAAGDGDAYELYLRALPLRVLPTREDSENWLALLRRAMELDPSFGPAKGDALACHVQRDMNGWSAPGERQDAIRLARATFVAHGDDPMTLASVSHALSILAYDHDAALEAALRAVELNPLSIWTRNAAGWARLRTGDPAIAIDHFEYALCLSSYDVDVGYVHAGLSVAHLALGAPAKALVSATKALRHLPLTPLAHRVAIVAFEELGDHQQAIANVRHFRQLMPEAAVIGDYQALYKDQAFARHMVRALQAAGLPG